MNFAQYITRIFSFSPSFVVNIRVASHQSVSNWSRSIATSSHYNAPSRLKYGQSTKAERMVIYGRLMVAFQVRAVITPEQWKFFTVEPSRAELYNILNTLGMLETPIGSIESAKNLLIAFDIKSSTIVDALLLTLYGKRYKESGLTEAEEMEVLRICNLLIDKKVHRSKFYKPKLVSGLSITSQWKQALSFPKSFLAHGGHTALINRAIQTNEWEIVWSLLYDAEHTSSSHMDTFIDKFGRNEIALNGQMPRLLKYVERRKEWVTEDQALELIRVLKLAGKKAEHATIDYSGLCSGCQQHIEAVTVTDDELEQLRVSFLRGVIKSRCITSTEGRSFGTFLRMNGPFDLVVDGLNIAFSRQGSCYSLELIADALDQLIETKNRILVIGREHILSRPVADLDRIRSKASLFLTKDDSKDDIFVLYAALANASNACDYLSNDFMTDHVRFAGNCVNIFYRWRQRHWYAFRYDDTGGIFTYQPIKFKNHCHEYNGRWHLPMTTDNDRTGRFIRNKTRMYWACIKL